MAFRSMRCITNLPLPEYASIWRVRSAARRAAVSMSRTVSWAGLDGSMSFSARPALPRMATSRLLKSWAMPPASTPRLSIFCACWISVSSFRRSSSEWWRSNACDSESVAARRRFTSSGPQLRPPTQSSNPMQPVNRLDTNIGMMSSARMP